MARPRSTPSRWLCATTALLLITLLAAGCGMRGHGAETDPDKGSDAEILNAALAEELTALDAYTRGMPKVKPGFAPAARRLRAQEQEYASAISKVIRGLGGEATATASELDFGEIRTQADVLTLAYELESEALAHDLEAAPRLFTDAPRTLAASLAAGHAQHLVVLRQGLGAEPAEAFPEAFDGGEVPPPGGNAPPGEG
jgi:Ferritin-like domain